MLGFFSLRKRPQPVMVPPVPTPLISTSTLPSVERQISGPEIHTFNRVTRAKAEAGL
jgi:hypothetical protein